MRYTREQRRAMVRYCLEIEGWSIAQTADYTGVTVSTVLSDLGSEFPIDGLSIWHHIGWAVRPVPAEDAAQRGNVVPLRRTR